MSGRQRIPSLGDARSLPTTLFRAHDFELSPSHLVWAKYTKTLTWLGAMINRSEAVLRTPLDGLCHLPAGKLK